jgi:CubicO group peptidase (beta-lactamase class C family)
VPWREDTLVPVWSATKGPAAVACLLALHEAHIPLHFPVMEVWPEFGTNGKEKLTFEDVLSHRAGLSWLSTPVPIFSFDDVITAIERQVPHHLPGTVQGYHARTFGFMLDEIVRRITGAESLGQYFDEVLGHRMAIDFWIGLPEAEYDRVAMIYPGKMNISQLDQAFIRAFNTRGSVTQRTFTSPVGLNAVQDFNQRHTWAQGYASMGGVGSAHGLGQFYALLANGGTVPGERLIPTWIEDALSTPLTQAMDEVLCVDAAFSAGMMMDPIDPETGEKTRQLFGPSQRAFGHPGAGGSLAFADPDNGIAFAFTMNQMEVGVLPSERARGLVEALYS